MLGHRLVRELVSHPQFDVHVTSRREVPEAFTSEGVTHHRGIDLTDAQNTIPELLRSVAPDAVINAAGVVKQRSDGQDIAVGLQLNGMLPHLLAMEAEAVSARLIHISTDCVFDGANGPYSQDSPRDATDIYGRTKALGEVWYPPHTTLRTSIIGFEVGRQQGLVEWLFSQPTGSTIPGWSRAIFSGVTTGELSRNIVLLLGEDTPIHGVWHLASEPIDKGTLLTALNHRFDLGLNIELVDEVQINRALDDTPIRESLGWPRPTWAGLIEDLAEDRERFPYRDTTAP
jgi:dTDP-4-dehydrorhamnose reductase